MNVSSQRDDKISPSIHQPPSILGRVVWTAFPVSATHFPPLEIAVFKKKMLPFHFGIGGIRGNHKKKRQPKNQDLHDHNHITEGGKIRPCLNHTYNNSSSSRSRAPAPALRADVVIGRCSSAGSIASSSSISQSSPAIGIAVVVVVAGAATTLTSVQAPVEMIYLELLLLLPLQLQLELQLLEVAEEEESHQCLQQPPCGQVYVALPQVSPLQNGPKKERSSWERSSWCRRPVPKAEPKAKANEASWIE